jgi:hypothetical protein
MKDALKTVQGLAIVAGVVVLCVLVNNLGAMICVTVAGCTFMICDAFRK